MKLYQHWLSPNTRRVRVVLHALTIPHEEVLVDLFKGENRQPEYLAKNPMGKVPTLEDDGFFLSESYAIMSYLAEKKPSALYPSNPRARADVNRWLFWGANHFSPTIGALVRENFLKKVVPAFGAPDPLQIKRQEDEFRVLAKVLDDHLGSRTVARKWLVGQDVTLADLALAAGFNMRERGKLPVENAPHLEAWFSRVAELEAWKATEPPPMPLPQG
jgi:glutathione S-transferase